MYICVYIYIYIYIYTYIYIYIQCFLIRRSEKTELIFLYLYIFVSISRNWKIFRQFILFPQNGKKKLNDLRYLQIQKNIKQKNWKIRLFSQCEKWSNFLYFSTYLTSFPRSGKNFIFAIYFHKISNFLQFFIHISFCNFHKVDYISPMRHISTKWKIFHL